jgi:ribosome-associated toxin RatA of RatAB toxin-antitoxin module
MVTNSNLVNPNNSTHTNSTNPGAIADFEVEPSVEVRTQPMEGRQRRISAKICIPYTIEQIWQILTDYETLADFIPNLSHSQRVEHPEGGVRLEQIGSQCLLNFHFCARVVLDMVEDFPHWIRFQMVEGDFRSFEGNWHLKPSSFPGGMGTELTYTVQLCPHLLMPVNIIEHRLSQNLRANLLAIRERAEELFGGVC